MKIEIALIALALAGCAKDQTAWTGPPPTANQYYSKLGKSQQKMFGTGYTYGMRDAAGRYEQAEREAQRHDAYAQPRQTTLRKKVVSLPVGPYQDEKGVWRSSDKRFIQINTVQ